jgi:GT2 family glycosyltransferase
MHLSVIVPIYQDWMDALSLVQHLSSQTLSADHWELLLVDNGSDYVPQVPVTDFPLKVLSCEVPGSYAARNAGVLAAKGDIMVFTDADCRPAAAWLEKIRERMMGYGAANVGLLAGDVIVRKLDEGSPNRFELYDMALGLPQRRYVQRGYAVTANLSIPRKVFEGVGVFDDKRYSGGDAEFCQRAIAHGYRLDFSAEALVYHPARQKWSQLAQKVRRVKGGQISNGPPGRRAKFFTRTLLPPLFAFWFVIRSDKLKILEKMGVCWIQLRLWGVELLELLRLLAGGTPERR